jgi:hypothetical protein
LKHARGEEEEEEEEEEAESWWWIVVYECAHRTKMYVMFVKDHPFVYLNPDRNGSIVRSVCTYTPYQVHTRTVAFISF